MYGLHAPVRLEMERNLVSSAPTPLSLGLPGAGFTRPSNLALDILTGHDEEIRPEDVLIGTCSPSAGLACRPRNTTDSGMMAHADRVHTAPLGDFHRTMERKFRIA